MQIERTSNMVICWKKFLGITTLSCNEGSIRLRPECPWRARKQTTVPESSVQHWNLLFTLLLLMPNMISIIRQTNGSIVGSDSEDFPSFSRNEPLRLLLDALVVNDEKDKITFFETSYSERDFFPASISIQFLLSMGTILGEEPATSLLCGFAFFAFNRHAKSFALSFNAYSSRGDLRVISDSLLFKFIPNSFDPWDSMFTVQITGCNFQYGPN